MGRAKTDTADPCTTPLGCFTAAVGADAWAGTVKPPSNNAATAVETPNRTETRRCTTNVTIPPLQKMSGCAEPMGQMRDRSRTERGSPKNLPGTRRRPVVASKRDTQGKREPGRGLGKSRQGSWRAQRHRGRRRGPPIVRGPARDTGSSRCLSKHQAVTFSLHRGQSVRIMPAHGDVATGGRRPDSATRHATRVRPPHHSGRVTNLSQHHPESVNMMK